VVELQLTLPTAYRTTILRRLVATAGWVAVIALPTATFFEPTTFRVRVETHVSSRCQPGPF
jgi:hypothetical protein